MHAWARLKLQAQVITKQCTREEADALGDKVLGIPYCAMEDKFEMKLHPSITISRKRGSKAVTILESKDIEAFRQGQSPLTKRTVLSVHYVRCWLDDYMRGGSARSRSILFAYV